jgi:hypothetical protein
MESSDFAALLQTASVPRLFALVGAAAPLARRDAKWFAVPEGRLLAAAQCWREFCALVLKDSGGLLVHDLGKVHVTLWPPTGALGVATPTGELDAVVTTEGAWLREDCSPDTTAWLLAPTHACECVAGLRGALSHCGDVAVVCTCAAGMLAALRDAWMASGGIMPLHGQPSTKPYTQASQLWILASSDKRE